MTSHEVYLLPLNDNGSPDVAGEYIYLAPQSTDPVIVRFVIEGASSICRHGSLWVNIPEQGQPFRRDKFREFPYALISPLYTPLLSCDVANILPSPHQLEARL